MLERNVQLLVEGVYECTCHAYDRWDAVDEPVTIVLKWCGTDVPVQ